jgi:hypothetical protein
VRNISNDLHLTRSSCLWTFQLLGFEVFQVRLQKNPTSTVSIEIHKCAIFYRLKISSRSAHICLFVDFFFFTITSVKIHQFEWFYCSLFVSIGAPGLPILESIGSVILEIYAILCNPSLIITSAKNHSSKDSSFIKSV